jgi:5-methylcytosine-specific restriction endonuclease McrA
MPKERQMCPVEGCGKILGPRNTIGYCRKHRNKSPIYQAKMKKYREDNKDAIRKKCQEYHKNHKEELNQVCRDWYWSNRDVSLERSNKWFEDHPNYRAEYYQENKTQIQERVRNFRADNKQHIRERCQGYYLENKNEIKQQHKEYYNDHKEEFNERSWRYRAQKLNVLEDFDRSKRLAALEAFGNRCFNCDSELQLQIDHFKPLSLGFALSFDNVCVLCKSCNGSKSDLMPEDFFTPAQIKKAKRLMKKAAKLYNKLKKQGNI